MEKNKGKDRKVTPPLNPANKKRKKKKNFELQQTKKDKAKKGEFIPLTSYKLKKKYKREAKKRQYLHSTP